MLRAQVRPTCGAPFRILASISPIGILRGPARVTTGRDEYGRAFELAAAETVERFIRLSEPKARRGRPHRNALGKIEKLAAIGAGQVRDRDDRALSPKVRVGKGGNVAHVNAGAHHTTTFPDVTKRS